MRKLKKIATPHSFEFELDLAPLLAVMVKLVPVLLLSSAFVQLSVVDTELPQPVKEAIQDTSENKNTSIQLFANSKEGFNIVIQHEGKSETRNVPLVENHFDLAGLNKALIEVKSQHPEVFKLEFNPSNEITYKDTVKIMDEARQVRDKKVTFPVMDKKNNKEIRTIYMFPNVVFGNMLEG